jgi:serine/threonine protein kinase
MNVPCLRPDGTSTTVLDTAPAGFQLEGVIAYGGMATVYAARDSGGKPHAAKVFSYPSARHTDPDVIEEKEWRLAQILDNVRRHKEVFSAHPFAAPTHIPENALWYATELIAGHSLGILDDFVDVSEATKHQAARTYASMLKGLHEKDMLFYDNNWGAVLVDGENIRICDYDFASPQAEIEKLNHYSRAIRHPFYAAREQILSAARYNPENTPAVSVHTDLQGFALMLDHLYLDSVFTDIDGITGARHYEDAKVNKRNYPSQRAAALPKPLQDVIPPLVQYPIDTSITLDNIIEAIERY